jgi:hypothetical protein
MEKKARPKIPDNILLSIEAMIEQTLGKKITTASVDNKVEKPLKKKDETSIEKEIKPIEEFIARQQYELQTRQYQQFMANYLAESMLPKKAGYDYSFAEEKQQWKWGDELISYKEREQVARVIMMNSLMGGIHNHAHPEVKERYNGWRDGNKFNMLVSFMMYDRASGTG